MKPAGPRPNLLIDGPRRTARTIILAHGAGAPMDTDFMNAFAQGLASHGLRVVRFEFPYMAERRATGKGRPPDREPVLRETWLQIIQSVPADTVFIGGKSMGGRIASLVADEAEVAGLVCLGYPFHPTGKPAQLRVEHLPDTYQLFTWADWSRIAPRDGDAFIQAVRLRLRVPEVIVLADYDRLPSAAVSFSRRNVFKRDHWTCQYCGVQPGGEELTIDHVVPRSQSGTSTWDNCVLSCIDCNKRKADRTPQQAGMKLHKAPVRPTWKPLYARHTMRIESWSKFISETYWNVPLES